MKKIALLIVFLSAFLYGNHVDAQPCTAGNYTASGIYPDSAIGLPKAYVNVAYNTVITVVVPTDTVLFGFSFAVDSIGISSVSGLPAGFAYSTNPTNDYIHGGASGCVLITGTPILSQIGIYPISITLESWVNHGTSSISDTHQGYYNLIIEEPVSIENVKNEEADLINYPNPFTKETAIQFNASVNENMKLSIYNSLGQVVYNEDLTVNKGENIHPLKLNVDDGIYFYTITGKNTSFRSKMTIKN